MKTHPNPFRWRGLVTVAVALAAAVPALPQAKTAAAGDPGEYSTYEISPFLGYQWFQIYANENTRVKKFTSAPVLGVRVAEDLWKYVGLEQSFTMGFNDLRIRPFGATEFTKANAHNYNLAINPVLYFKPRQSKIRPFLTVGPGVTWYRTAKGIGPNGVTPYVAPGTELRNKYGPALIYGGGIKIAASRAVGLRFDLRGMWTQQPHFELPDFPNGPGSLFIPRKGGENALAATGGIVFRFGHKSDYVAPPPPPPPPPPAPKDNVQVGNIMGAHDACPGESVNLSVNASGWVEGHTPTYQWMVNGSPAPGGNGSNFSLSTVDGSGNKSITVKVTAGESSATSQPVNVRIKDYSAPTVNFAISPSTVPFGTKVPLAAVARGSECGDPVSLSYRAAEGTISGTTFDTGSLSFDMSNRLKQQTKTVAITANASDKKGGTGSANASVTVTLKPEARRLDDIVFPNLSARVNNCAKRLLLEVLTPMLRDDPNATVILIGHRDEREKGRVASTLDRRRVLNAAAVLSAGKGICPQLDLSRVKVSAVGADQSSTPKPSLCGTSTDVKEKGGQAIKSSDQRAQFRRVEVWIVPGGADAPSVGNLMDAPASDIQKLACPK
jgi:outer membrane protein OmpA-like peptidoglycan-associated protein